MPFLTQAQQVQRVQLARLAQRVQLARLAQLVQLDQRVLQVRPQNRVKEVSKQTFMMMKKACRMAERLERATHNSQTLLSRVRVLLTVKGRHMFSVG